MTPLTYSADEAAALYGCSAKHIRELARDGRLPAVSLDPLRISRAALHRLLDRADWQPASTRPSPRPAPSPQRRAAPDPRVLDYPDLARLRDERRAAAKAART